MTCLTLDVAVERLRLAAPFRISGQVFDGRDAILVTIGDGTHVGRGEASGVYYLGDDVPVMIDAVEQARGAVEAGRPPSGRRRAGR